MKNNKLIVVLGMHRSGTSAITRGLQVMGVELGDNLMPPIEDNNPKGFWEDLDIFALNVEMLSAIENDWCCLKQVSERDIEVLHEKGYFERSIELLRQKVEGGHIFGIKDPRISKLLPFWKAVFNYCQFDVSYVIALRHPLSVASSLAKRDDLEIEYSYLLWLGHVISSLTNSGVCNRVLVDYDRLMQSPDHELERIAKNTGLVTDSAKLESYKNDFLEHGLRHTVYDVNDLVNDSCPPIVREVYLSLLDVASDKASLDDLESKIALWSDEFSGLKSSFVLIDRLTIQKYAATVAVNERDEQINSLKQIAAEREGQITVLNQVVTERDEQIDQLNQGITERNDKIDSLNQSVSVREESIYRLNQEVLELEDHIGSLSRFIVERQTAHQQVLAHVFNSSSWRLTHPIRHVGTQIKRILLLMKSFPSALRRGEGVGFTVDMLANIVKKHPTDYEQWLRSRTRSSTPPVRANFSRQTAKDTTDNKQIIPCIDFDQTRNRYIEYQKNPPIKPMVKLIAFYLPQFHPFPENDIWWGKGFTEWTNVGKALPNYVGHYQPHCPIHQGYYDLRVPEVMEEQARLAKEYGIYGFSYYFYWFDGKILMGTPLELMLSNKKVDIPFCLTWANENWSRRWDGQENDILIAQNHCNEDSLAFILHLVKFFKDERYICIDGKPVLIIYRANIIPNIAATAKLWRTEMIKQGFPGLYLISAETFGIRTPEVFDFDASVEFPPHAIKSAEISNELKLTNPEFHGRIYCYEQVVANAVISKEPDYKLYRTAMLSWDNTARKQNNSHIFYDFSLLRYKQWLSSNIDKVHSNPKYTADEKIVFVNAWNEWAEGTHLEPDQKFGYGYLQTTYDALSNYNALDLEILKKNQVPVKRHDFAVILHLHYVDLWDDISRYLTTLNAGQKFDLYVSATSSAAAQKVLEVFPEAYIELVENRGRDILPFIRILKIINNLDYKAVCKIHSKKSAYRNDGDNIRDEIFNALLGSSEQVERILSRFRNSSKLGMVVPKKYLLEHNDFNMTFDKEVVDRVSSAINVKFKYNIFPAGSMFWFAPKSLKPLLDIDHSFFDIESGLADGTCAHAIERLFCLIVRNSKYEIESC